MQIQFFYAPRETVHAADYWDWDGKIQAMLRIMANMQTDGLILSQCWDGDRALWVKPERRPIDEAVHLLNAEADAREWAKTAPMEIMLPAYRAACVLLNRLEQETGDDRSQERRDWVCRLKGKNRAFLTPRKSISGGCENRR